MPQHGYRQKVGKNYKNPKTSNLQKPWSMYEKMSKCGFGWIKMWVSINLFLIILYQFTSSELFFLFYFSHVPKNKFDKCNELGQCREIQSE